MYVIAELYVVLIGGFINFIQNNSTVQFNVIFFYLNMFFVHCFWQLFNTCIENREKTDDPDKRLEIPLANRTNSVYTNVPGEFRSKWDEGVYMYLGSWLVSLPPIPVMFLLFFQAV